MVFKPKQYYRGLQTQNSELALTDFQGWSGRMKKGGEISQAERIIACPSILLTFYFQPCHWFTMWPWASHFISVSIFSFVMQDNKYYFLFLSWVMWLSASINIYWMTVRHITLGKSFVLGGGCWRRLYQWNSFHEPKIEDLQKTELLELKIARAYVLNYASWPRFI